jgi:hypothetical protein
MPGAAAQKHDGRACARPSRSQRCYPLLGTTIRSATWRGKGPGSAEMVAVNVRCLDGVDVDTLKVKKVDGRSR